MISERHYHFINTNRIVQKKIYENPSKLIYIYLNGSERYRTSCVGLLPKIIGTSYNLIVEIESTTMTCRYITTRELAEAQGYTNIRVIDESFFARIIGNSIPKPLIENEIINSNIVNPTIGVIGGYGLEGSLLIDINCDFKFLTMTNHINNNYLTSKNIESVLNYNNPPEFVYQPNNYHNQRVDILIWKFPCKYGSTQSRNSNYSKQVIEKEHFEDEVNDNAKYINKYSPKTIIMEFPSNINHKLLDSKTEKKIYYIKRIIGTDYTCKWYPTNTKDYGLKQNRRSYIIRFELNLPI